jgi:NADPH2:quinone reductase
MRALVVHEFGPVHSHHVENVPSPTITEKDVLIEVHAIGLNFPDTLMLQGKYQTRPDRPFIPGRDAAGVVRAIGPEVTRVKIGDRVMAQVPTGAFAEQTPAHESRCFVIPQSLDFVTAAGMLTNYHAAYVAAVIRGQLSPGETVLITGASGGVGLAAVQIAKAKGARVLAGVSSAEKGKIVKANGADHLIDLSVSDLHENLRQQVFALTSNRGVEAVIELIGGAIFHAALRAVAYGGRMIIAGFVTGDIPQIKAHHVLLKNISVIGAPIDIRFKMEPKTVDATYSELIRMFENGQIKPQVMATFPLDQIHRAIDVIVERKVTGKVVLTTR